MTTIHTRARVDIKGKITISVGRAEAGRDVEVMVSPASSPETINGIPRDEWFEILERTAGSISGFTRLPQGVYANRVSFD